MACHLVALLLPSRRAGCPAGSIISAKHLSHIGPYIVYDIEVALYLRWLPFGTLKISNPKRVGSQVQRGEEKNSSWTSAKNALIT